MSSSKVIYVNDDDMLGGMFNNETKPSNTQETTSEHTQATSQLSVEQSGGKPFVSIQAPYLQPLIPRQVPMDTPSQPMMGQQNQVITNEPIISNQQQPIMSGGKEAREEAREEAKEEAKEEAREEANITDDDDNDDDDDNGKDIANNDDNNSCSDASSICTDQLLTFDPMYIKLTKFLYTSGHDGNPGKNITQVLEGIEKQMERLTDALLKSAMMHKTNENSLGVPDDVSTEVSN